MTLRTSSIIDTPARAIRRLERLSAISVRALLTVVAERELAPVSLLLLSLSVSATWLNRPRSLIASLISSAAR
ncbi:hypothetical protein D3C85_1841050 [compost metagenome]